MVAILDNKVIAASASFKGVAEIVDSKFKGKKPLIARIPARTAFLRN